jgi:hypothetical protein
LGNGEFDWKIEKRFGKHKVLAAAENFTRLPETSVRCGKLQTKNQKSGDELKSSVGEPQTQSQTVRFARKIAERPKDEQVQSGTQYLGP